MHQAHHVFPTALLVLPFLVALLIVAVVVITDRNQPRW